MRTSVIKLGISAMLLLFNGISQRECFAAGLTPPLTLSWVDAYRVTISNTSANTLKDVKIRFENGGNVSTISVGDIGPTNNVTRKLEDKWIHNPPTLKVYLSCSWYLWNEVLAFDTRPDLPVKVSYRTSLLGSGYVVTICSTSDKSIRMIFEYDLFSRRTFVLDAGSTQEFGYQGERAFASGDSFEISADGYRTYYGSIR